MNLSVIRLSVLFTLLVNPLDYHAQDLISDGDFELFECPDNQINSVTETITWYATGADVYWLHPACPFDREVSVAVRGLNKPIRSYSGFGHIYLEAGLSYNGFLISEGFGIELDQVLEKDHFYYFEMASLNCSEVDGQGFPDNNCAPLPPRFVSLYLSDEKIQTSIEQIQLVEGALIQSVTLNGSIRTVDTKPQEPDFEDNEWNFFWDCFEGSGNDRHMAVVGSNGALMDTLDCIDSSRVGFAYSFGYAIDAIRLVAIPSEIDTVVQICPEGQNFDLQDFIDGPFFDKATIQWDDGFEGTQRMITEEGLYNIMMHLPCVSVPIDLDVRKVECLADIYVANGFSPNGDGINDVLIPGFEAVFPLNSFSFSVYNRWGEKVYESQNPIEGWDGTFRKRNADIGVYTWLLTYELQDGSGQTHRESGDTVLLRY